MTAYKQFQETMAKLKYELERQKTSTSNNNNSVPDFLEEFFKGFKK